MLRRVGAQVGLLAFALAVFVGVRAGNTPATILQRAILSLAVGFVVGQFAAWTGRLAVREGTRFDAEP